MGEIVITTSGSSVNEFNQNSLCSEFSNTKDNWSNQRNRASGSESRGESNSPISPNAPLNIEERLCYESPIPGQLL